MPNVVFFDLVGTLIRGTKPIGEQYADLAREFGADSDPSRLEAAFRAAMAEAAPLAFPGRSLGETAGLERLWWTGIVHKVVAQAGLSDALRGETFDRFFVALYDHFTTADAWELFPDVLPVLRTLKARGTRLGLITNYDTRVFAVLDALGIASCLDSVTIPAHAGVAKPDPAIFSHALARLDATAAESVHVGDEIDDDYRGAEAAGLGAVLIDRMGKFRGQNHVRRVESLNDLL